MAEGALYAVTVAPEGGEPDLDWLETCAAALERQEPDADQRMEERPVTLPVRSPFPGTIPPRIICG